MTIALEPWSSELGISAKSQIYHIQAPLARWFIGQLKR